MENKNNYVCGDVFNIDGTKYILSCLGNCVNFISLEVPSNKYFSEDFKIEKPFNGISKDILDKYCEEKKWRNCEIQYIGNINDILREENENTDD